MKKSIVTLAVLAMAATIFTSGQSQGLSTSGRLLQAKGNNGKIYNSDYASKEEALAAGLKVNQQISEEGMVLLKNENNALPLAAKKGTSAGRVTLLGYRGARPQGGADSTGDASAGKVKLTADIYSSLEDAGFLVNPVVKDTYEDLLNKKNDKNKAIYTDDISLYKEMFGKTDNKTKLEDSFRRYSDAAIVVLSSGTGSDRTHSLQFDKEQFDLIDEAKAHFDKVIVLINNSVPVELDKLKKDKGIDAILVIGQPGDNGFTAVGRILNGEVNPSGHLVDTFASDFTKDPSYQNVNVAGDPINGNPKYWIDKNNNGTKDEGEETADSYFCDYDEGIYVGYRYYETADQEAKNGNYTGFDYDSMVTYPFGYGLSYTDFEWRIVSKPTDDALKVGNTLNFIVKVTNTGDVAGKDVVQMYYSAPYTAYDKTNKVEKSSVVLGDFAKTGLLNPGESEYLKLSIDVNELASYDYKLAKTYILDEGDYTFSFRSDAHNIKDITLAATYNLAAFTKVDKAVTGKSVTNAFDDVSKTAEEKHDVGSFTRADFAGTFPKAETEAEAKLTQEEYDALAYKVSDKVTDPWYTDTMPKFMTAEDRAAKPTADVLLKDLIGLDYDDPKWETLLDELTLDEMKDLITNAGFRTQAIDYIGKPYSLDTDGPKGWTGTGTAGSKFNSFAAEPVIASTFSKSLAYEMGKVVGDQGLWGCSDRTDTDVGGKVYAYTGWYAPGMNIHRSPFDGRITEYFSEDPLLTGEIAANQSLGLKSKGAFLFMKHYAVHEDGGGVGISITLEGKYSIKGYRGSSDPHSATAYWVTEQTLREIYLKPFQIAVEDGEAGACMSSFSRIGDTWAGGDYGLLTTTLRDEWGFKGYVVTDINIYGFLNVDQMIRAGGDCLLTSGINSTGNSVGLEKWASDDSNKDTKPTQVASMRRAAKAILYTVCNSHAMDVPHGSKVIAPNAEITSATVGQAYQASFATETNTKTSYSSVKYALEGDVPEGLVIDENTGMLTGTPTTAGRYTFRVIASAEGYETGIQEVTLTVASAASKTIADLEKELADLKAEKDSGDKTNADKITELEKQIEELKTQKSSGCGGSIIAMTSALLSVSAIALGLVFKKKKEE